MANRCFLYASDGSTDSIAVDSDRVNAIRNTDATTVVVDFADAAGAAKAITLGVTSGKAESVCREIGRLVLSGRGVIVLADDQNGIYGVDGIEEVDTITHS